VTTPAEAGDLTAQAGAVRLSRDETVVPPSVSTVRNAAQTAQLPRTVISTGVADVRLWSGGRSAAGERRLDPDAALATHSHRRHCHHLWIVDGVAMTMDRTLTRGSHAYVPPDRPHDLAGGPEGATVFYLHLDTGPPHAEG
jgi:hypothetical protein